MKNKLLYGVITVLLLSLAGVSCFAVSVNSKNAELLNLTENEMAASLNNAISTLRSAEADLSKLMITNERQTVNKTLSTLALKTADCSQSLSLLPIVATGVQNTLKFANQLSSYCTTVLHSEALPENFDEQIISFFNTCKSVNEELSTTEDELNSGEIKLSQLFGGDSVSSGIFGSIADDAVEYPSVIFDGPFSDGQEATTPKTERNEVSVDEASTIVASLGFNCEFSGETNGVIPLYTFSSDGVTVQITKKGGIPYCIVSELPSVDDSLTEEEAEDAAKVFAEKAIGADASIVWRESYTGYRVFNFAPTQDGIILYPDLFKVKVANCDGSIIGFEAKSYIMNSRVREIKIAEISENDALTHLKNGFTVEASRLVLISVSDKEYLAYEFFGTYNSLNYAVYISASDGMELTSFRIIGTASGQMAI